VHPHRNLILKAIDGIHDLEPDLFVLEVKPKDRLLFCSDGASGVLDAGRLADILSSGSPDYAATELVRASLEAGSSDNVTCLVADVVEGPVDGEPGDPPATPLLVGAAAEMRARRTRAAKTAPRSTSLFRGHRAGDTGELEPIRAEIPDEVPFAIPSDPIRDPETARYAPRPPDRFTWLRRLLALMVVVGVVWVVAAAAWAWSQDQFYVGEQDGTVVIYRGLDASLPGLDLSEPYESTNVELDRLSDFEAQNVREGIDASSLADARKTVESLAENMSPAEEAPAASGELS
jgi:protein phosphatase